jgi:hypothetical protein
MVRLGARHDALRLQTLLRELLGHEAVAVRPHGQHLIIDTTTGAGPYPVARLTQLGSTQYEAAFRSHTGRWEPLPLAGSFDEVARGLVDLLGIYLNPSPS